MNIIEKEKQYAVLQVELKKSKLKILKLEKENRRLEKENKRLVI